MPEVKFMRLKLLGNEPPNYEIEYNEIDCNPIQLHNGDVVIVMKVHGILCPVQSFDSDWFSKEYNVDVSSLPEFTF